MTITTIALNRLPTWQERQERNQNLAEQDYLEHARADVAGDTIDHDRVATCPIYRAAVFASLLREVRAHRAKERPYYPSMAITGGDREGGNSSWLDDEF